jgi:DnaJ-class molecular chaperone
MMSLTCTQDKFVLINEAYSVLSDPDQRRKYDFFGAGSTSTGTSGRSYSGRNTGTYSSTTGTSSGSGFDFDSYWNQYRSKEERPQDIDDSFSRIINDLFTGTEHQCCCPQLQNTSAVALFSDNDCG